ncbi:MAG: redoxin domain-containing protein [Bacteroidales bacterium]|nr:redoxin domain-containing protein [Bacteroidales bacterium]
MRSLFRKILTYFFMPVMYAVIFTSCSTEIEDNIPMVSFEKLEPIFKSKSDTVYVVNFWATWCKPCIKELPAFDELTKEYKGQKVRILLVSLDFPNKHESDLLPFIKEHKLRSEVVHLTDVDANKWIDKVSPLWSGSIPATIILKGNKREFYERSLTFEELDNIVKSKMEEE